MKMNDVFETALKCTTKEGAVSYLEEHFTPMAELSKDLAKALEGVASSEHKVHMGGVDITLNTHTADSVITVLSKAKELLKEHGND